MSSFTFMHLANHGGRNIGNAALIYGLERTLQEDLGDGIAFRPERWDDYTRGLLPFDERFVERVNSECDALLVGAAVSFAGRAGLANTGFRFNLPLELWERIDRPIVFYGLSYRAWSDTPYQHVDALRRAVDYATTSDRVLFSVRTDGTKEWLESILRRAEPRIHTVPDPALYVPVEDSWHPEIEDGKVNVIVAPNIEDEIYRWGGRPEGLWVRRLRRATGREPAWRVRRARFVRGLADALEQLAARWDLNVIFAAHDSWDHWMSLEVFGLLSDELGHRSVFANAGLPVWRGLYFYDLYAKAALALSMRIHSMNPSIGLGTPVVPLLSQDRMRAFMVEAGLGDLCVDVLDPAVGERIYAAATKALEDGDEIRERLANARTSFRERTAQFNHLVGEFVGIR